MRTGVIRVTKREWYDTYGGFRCTACFRRQGRGGAWRYYVDTTLLYGD